MGKKKSQFKKKFYFILSLFSILLIFLLGVEVGRRFSGMPLRGQKSGNEKRHLAGNEPGGIIITEALDDSLEEKEPEPKITFYDYLQGKSNDQSVNTSKEGAQEESIIHPEQAKQKNAVPLSEDSHSNHQSSKYALQLGSYKVRSQAELLEQDLKSKGYNAYIVEANIPEKGIWYRVKIGDYDDLEQVRQVAENLQKNEGKSSIITGVSR